MEVLRHLPPDFRLILLTSKGTGRLVGLLFPASPSFIKKSLFLQLSLVLPQVCFGGRGRVDSCTSDSGGPLFQVSNDPPRFVLVSGVGWERDGCCSRDCYMNFFSSFFTFYSAAVWFDNDCWKLPSNLSPYSETPYFLSLWLFSKATPVLSRSFPLLIM